jgi:DNA-binding beta-propeller fold protein YncE
MTARIKLILACIVFSFSPAQAEVNPNQLGVLRWFHANQSGNTISTPYPLLMASDGQNIWVTNSGTGSGGGVNNQVTIIRQNDGAIIDTLTVGIWPDGITYDGTYMWIRHWQGVSKIRAADRVTVDTYPVGVWDGGVLFDGKSIWVTDGFTQQNLFELDPQNGTIISEHALPAIPMGYGGMAFDGENLWICSGKGAIKFSPQSDQVVGTYGNACGGIVFTGRYIVTGLEKNAIQMINPKTGRVVTTRSIQGNPGWQLTFDGQAIWIPLHGTGKVLKIDANNGRTIGSYDTFGTTPLGAFFDGTNVWITKRDSGAVVKM